MLPISKILTLNKLHVLERIGAAGEPADAPPLDYFHLGYPIVDPPLIRGSMILEMNLRFLADNRDFFEYGSPVDLGGIRFGFLQPPDVDLFIANVTCDHSRFMRLVEDLQQLPAHVLSDVLHHRRTPAADDVLGRHFDRRVVDFMLSSDAPNAWIFEFALRKGYRISGEQVEALIHPNPYTDAGVFRRLRQKIGNRARTYNPKFGIESEHELGHDRHPEIGDTGIDYYVVGAYEDLRLDVFPTHVAPIVVEHGAPGFRRWSYRIERPYRLRPVAPMGAFHPTMESLFPVLTYHLSAPQKLTGSSQVIAMSRSELVVDANRLSLLLKLLAGCVKNVANAAFLKRAWQTLRNVFEDSPVRESRPAAIPATTRSASAPRPAGAPG